MTSDQIGNLVYLSLLVGVLGFWALIESRNSIATKVKHASAWVLIFVGVLAAVGLWSDIRDRSLMPRQAVFAEAGRVELPRQSDGHYLATLTINGAPITFMVDTGASGIVLTRQDAARVGLETETLAFVSEATTANGSVRTAPVWLEEVRLGPFEDRSLPAFVNGGEMDRSLLGMSYLQRFDRLEISGGRLVLER
jgi:aspartyl protease family protein